MVEKGCERGKENNNKWLMERGEKVERWENTGGYVGQF